MTWWTEAACRPVDAAIFDYPEADEARSMDRGSKRVDEAKAICASCHVAAACLADALAARDSGVRGGVLLDRGTPVNLQPRTQPPAWIDLLRWHAEMDRCRKAGETPSAECVEGERRYQAECHRRRKARKGAA